MDNTDKGIYIGEGTWDNTMEHTEDMEQNTVKPMATKEEIAQWQEEDEDLNIAEKVMRGGYPNRYGARIPIKSPWNVQALKHKLQANQYQDMEITEWLTFGWPAGRLPTLQDPEKTFKNHKGATDYPQALRDYIKKEKEKGAIMGPFNKIPFSRKVGISPISTRAKKSSQERRVIVDLSFPEGRAVNDGMIKDNYMGLTTHLSFPKTDELANRIYILGKGAMMFKVDLSRYFRQLPLDPGDYSLMGYIVDNQLYFDKMLPMGMRNSPYIAQRISDAIRFLHKCMGFFMLNYVDDFLGAELAEHIWQAYKYLTQLLEEIKIGISKEKLVPPTTRLEFLGITFDSDKMTMELPQDKVEDLQVELGSWLYKTMASRREMESLVGKLQFASKCIRPGRVFVARLINWMRNRARGQVYKLNLEVRKDIAWWSRFMQEFNGMSLIWLNKEPRTDYILASDACLTGFGATAMGEYFHGEFPMEMQGDNIAYLEIRAAIVALKVWGPRLTGNYFWIHVDNQAVATILNTGASRDETLQDALREVAYLAAKHEFVIKARHIAGVDNRIPDWLSRWRDPRARKEFTEHARHKSLKRVSINDKLIEFSHKW